MSQITPEFSLTPPQEFAFSMLQLFEEGSKVMVEASRHTDQIASPLSIAQKIVDASQTMRDIAQDWMSEPARLAEAQAELMQGYVNIWHNTAQCMMGQEPVVEPKTGDHRFKDPEWSSNPYFDYWKQMYLLTSNWAEDVLEKTNGLDDEEKHKARFALHQTTSALSPANFPLTNPEVMRTTLETKGQNLVKGMGNLLGDLKKSNGTLRISQTDTSAFEVGGNLAVTPGKIVYQNDIMQLIQYAPATEKVHRTPLLIVPPWINKFYILDLTQSKSFIRYIVDQGFTVFVVSWANPDEKMAGQTFENYMRDGILTAAQAVQRETGEGQCNVLGYCIGGTLLAATLAYLAGRDEKPFGSATFLTTQIDFTKAGDLKIFIDDLQLNALEAMMHQQGYLDGAQMAGVFNMLRPRDLIWPYVINNYMLGKKPFAFDILYWNQDSTRMAAANHQFYLRSFYMENKLARGEMSLGGVDLDMSRVTLPVYELATREDHIAPAQSVLKGAKLFGGPVEYVLAGSGHIAGVLNPPNKERIKYQYWTNPNGLKCDTIDHWLKTAAETPGSWWGHWAEWLAGYSGDKVAARTPGQVLEIIEDAPGTYVKVSF
ncbi:MAG: class I poly(R)-hydroxyalkanoic acid synthase [Pseudomonadota bacterium]